jgi:membrane-associated phospholipid phosphatase
MKRWRIELALFAAAWAIYDLARWIAVGEIGPATANAHWVLDVERGVGVAVEHSVQQGLDAGWLVWLLSNVYLAAQLLVVPGSLIYLYRRSPAVYKRLRDTILATWMLAVPIYALFPVAPPRLAGIGMADTVSDQAGVALTGHSTVFYNPLAAVPSLHCGFAFAIGIALAAAARRPWTKALALSWGPIVSLAVVATGNHYVFDIAAGLLVSVLGYVVGPLPARLVARSRRMASTTPAVDGRRRSLALVET